MHVRDHQKTNEIYAGHIEMGTRKQTNHLADFWKGKLIDPGVVASNKSSAWLSFLFLHNDLYIAYQPP